MNQSKSYGFGSWWNGRADERWFDSGGTKNGRKVQWIRIWDANRHDSDSYPLMRSVGSMFQAMVMQIRSTLDTSCNAHPRNENGQFKVCCLRFLKASRVQQEWLRFPTVWFLCLFSSFGSSFDRNMRTKLHCQFKTGLGIQEVLPNGQKNSSKHSCYILS